MEKAKFVQELENQIHNFNIYQNFSEIVILCIGTDKLIGDAVGPMVGEKLQKESKIANSINTKKEIIVLGNMEQTLNYKNAQMKVKQIYKKCKMPFIITVDTALSKEKWSKKIYITKGKIQIGNSLGKSMLFESHINIKCVVGEYQNTVEKNMEILKKVNPELVIELSEIVAYGVNRILEKILKSYLD